MKAEYILGVDGGNTKTHYFLYDGEGNFVDCIKAGTCSHEALPDSYVGTGRELDRRLTELFPEIKFGYPILPMPFSALPERILNIKNNVCRH